MHGKNCLLSSLLLVTTRNLRTSLQLATSPHLLYVPLLVPYLQIWHDLFVHTIPKCRIWYPSTVLITIAFFLRFTGLHWSLLFQKWSCATWHRHFSSHSLLLSTSLKTVKTVNLNHLLHDLRGPNKTMWKLCGWK